MNLKVEQEKKFNIKKAIIFGGLLVILILYSIYQSYELIKSPTNTVTILEGKVYMKESTVGYVIREETVEQGENHNNGIEEVKTEGEKVAKDNVIFRYYGDNEEQLTETIEELNSQIQTSLEKRISKISNNDIITLDEKIDQKIKHIKTLNSMQDISEYKKDINTLLSKKLELISNSSEIDNELKNLIEQKKQYEHKLTEGGEFVTASVSGIVSYRVDGLEEILNIEDFGYLNSEFLNGLNLKTGQIVSSSNQSAKIVNNFKCYIAFCTDSAEVDLAKIGDNITVRLSTGDEVSAEIVYIGKEQKEKTVVVQITKCVDKLVSYRKVSIDVVWWSDSGLKVPNSALVEENGLYFVVRNRVGYLNKILVKVLRRNENYSIVTNYTSEELKQLGYTDEIIQNMKKLKLYDDLILEPDITVEF